jgi:hypothetical protein
MYWFLMMPHQLRILKYCRNGFKTVVCIELEINGSYRELLQNLFQSIEGVEEIKYVIVIIFPRRAPLKLCRRFCSF